MALALSKVYEQKMALALRLGSSERPGGLKWQRPYDGATKPSDLKTSQL